MDRSGIPGAPRRDRRAGHRRQATGITVIDRGGYWHIRGTMRAGSRSIRVRRSLGLPATAENREAAEALRLQLELEIRDEIAFGRKPTVALAVAAKDYLSRPRERPLGATTIAHIQWVTGRFGKLPMNSIADRDWSAFIADRSQGNTAATRERFLNSVMGFLTWAHRKPRQYITELPTFDRDNKARQKRSRKRRRVAELTPALLTVFLEAAPVHLMGQLVVLWVTGWRISSVVLGTRLCDLILAIDRQGNNRSSITTHRTKNGEPVTAAIPAAAVPWLKRYLDWRGRLHEREAPLFLTDIRQPYSQDVTGYSKSAFRSARHKAVREIRRHGAVAARGLRRSGAEGREAAKQAIEQARAGSALMSQVTPHWFRHRFATMALAGGVDVRTGMEQGGWLDYRSFMGYAHDVPDHRRHALERVVDLGLPADDAGKNLTQGLEAERKKDA